MVKGFTPGVVISILGICGMFFAFADPTGNIGSRVPIVVFFIVIMFIGIALELAPKDWFEDTFGEQQREFS